MSRLPDRLARWALASLAVLVLAGAALIGPLALADPAPAGDEFADTTPPTVALAGVLRVNRHPLDTDLGQWHATSDGVVIAPGVIVTLRALTDGLTSDEDLQVIGQDHVAYAATINTSVDDDELVVLNVPGLRAARVSLAQSPLAAGDAVTAAGYSMTVQTETSGDTEVRRWTVTPNLLNGHVTADGDPLTHDVATGYGYGGGALLDRCGHVAGLLTETLEEDGQATQSAVGLERLRAVLRSAGVTPSVAPGWCAPADTVTRVRAARRQLAAADAGAAAIYRGTRGAMLLQRSLGLLGGTVLGAAIALAGLFGAGRTLLRRGDPERPQRKTGMILVFAGLILAGLGVAVDPLGGLMHPPSRMVRLTCTFDPSASSAGVNGQRPLTLSFDPINRCRGGTPQSGDLHYAVGVADPGSHTPVFIRTIRPAAAARQMGPGRPPIIETHVFSTDLTHYDIRRYALPPVLFPRVQTVFNAHNTEQTCQSPEVSDASQAGRRQLVLPYAGTPQGELVSHTAFVCRPTPGSG